MEFTDKMRNEILGAMKIKQDNIDKLIGMSVYNGNGSEEQEELAGAIIASLNNNMSNFCAYSSIDDDGDCTIYIMWGNIYDYQYYLNRVERNNMSNQHEIIITDIFGDNDNLTISDSFYSLEIPQ